MRNDTNQQNQYSIADSICRRLAREDELLDT